jgi:hypothetical protein
MHALLEVHSTTFLLSIFKDLEMAPKIKVMGFGRDIP